MTEDELDSRSVAQDPTGVGQRLYFQRVPEGKVVKNRIHLDINASEHGPASLEEIEAEKDRIVALGAVVDHQQPATDRGPDFYFYVMRDPEGNEFCIH